MTRPEDIVNRALDEIGVDEIGDLYEGSKSARAALRIYDPILRQMHAAANWNFARAQMQLVMLADRTGVYSPQTDVLPPWSYMYDWPVDAVHARYVMLQGVTALDTVSGAQIGAVPGWHGSAPFIVANANRVNDGEWDAIEGHDPESTRVILTDQLGAVLVYTRLIQYPDAWDPLFEQAMVASLAARLAMPLQPDKRIAIQLRRDNLDIAREALANARVRDANEGWTIVNHTPDWILARDGNPRFDGSSGIY